jgi:Iodothyronine deiodinase
VGVVQQEDGTLFPVCERHAEKAAMLAFRVARPTDSFAPGKHDLTVARVGVGDAAPNVELPSLDGTRGLGEVVRVATAARGRPVALVFGSYNVPKFRKYLGEIEDLYQRYCNPVCFFLVYTQEVRFGDGRIADPRHRPEARPGEPESLVQRAERASKLVHDYGLSIPVLVDRLDDEVARTFGAFPLRLYLVGRDGRIAYQGPLGPYAFQPGELKNAIREELGGH